MHHYHSESASDFNQSPNYDQIALIKAKIKQERYFRRLRSLLLVILIIASIYLWETRSEIVPVDKALLALGITWVALFPTFQYLSNPQRPPMPFFPLVGLFYATSFGLPVFGIKEGNEGVLGRFALINSNVTEEALTLTLLGLIGMNIAFFISDYNVWCNVKPFSLTQNFSLKKLLITTWLLFLLRISYIYLPFVSKIPSLNMFVLGATYVAYGIFYVLWHRGLIPKKQVILLFFIFIPLEIIPRIASGLLAEVMTLCLFIFNIIWYETKKFPVVLLTILIIFYLAFSPVKSQYRNVTWYSKSQANLNVIERLQIFVDLTIKYHQENIFNHNTDYKNNSQKDNADKLVERSAQIVILSKVIKSTPEIVPYWNGQTYSPIFTSLIPRIVWQDKPVQTLANDFGRRYNLLDKNDFSTSINLPIIVEMYVNFGEWGILLGMPLFGMFLAFVDHKLNNLSMNSIEFVVGASSAFQLTYQETSFAVYVGTLIPFLVSIHFLFKFLTGNKKDVHSFNSY